MNSKHLACQRERCLSSVAILIWLLSANILWQKSLLEYDLGEASIIDFPARSLKVQREAFCCSEVQQGGTDQS